MKGFLGAGSNSGGKAATVETLIGRRTEIVGDVRFTGGIHVDGRIKGLVVSSGDKTAMLSLSESGVIEGDVRVPTMMLNGVVVGDVRASEKLVLNAKARVTGNVYYKVLQMEPGATINGQLVHDSAEMVVLTHQNSLESRAETATLEVQDGASQQGGMIPARLIGE